MSSIGSLSPLSNVRVAFPVRLQATDNDPSGIRIERRAPKSVAGQIDLRRASSQTSLDKFEGRIFEIEAETIADTVETATGVALSQEQYDSIYLAVANDDAKNLEETVVNVTTALLSQTTGSATAAGDAVQLVARLGPQVEAQLSKHEHLYQELDRRVLGSDITNATGLELSDHDLDKILDVLDRTENEDQASFVIDSLLAGAIGKSSRYDRSSVAVS